MSVTNNTKKEDVTESTAVDDLLENTNNCKNSKLEMKKAMLETLKGIQGDNPHIETVFLESDEEEQTDSAEETIKNINISIENSNTKVSYNIINNSKPVAPKFNVKEVSMGQLDKNLLKASNAIEIGNASALNTANQKFLVIPKDVLPLFAAAKGPIQLNVPGIGPLLIPNPSQILTPSQRENFLTVVNHQQPSVVATTTTTTTTTTTNNNNKAAENPSRSKNKVDDPMADSKFKCWKYRKGIKRDLEGFSINDRLGFYKTETKRCEVCDTEMKQLVQTLANKINFMKKQLTKMQIQKELTKNNDKKLTPMQKRNLKTLMKWKEQFKEPLEISSTESDSEEDLLITKKMTHPRGRKRKRSTETSVEEVQVKRKPGRPRKTPIKPEDSETPELVRQTRGKSKKTLVETPAKKTNNQYALRRRSTRSFNNKNKTSEDSESSEENEEENENWSIITKLKDFIDKIDSKKPLLIVNKAQLPLKGTEEFSKKNNIVYKISEIGCFSSSFTANVLKHNILLVTPHVLCRYFYEENAEE